ncbi:MAG TPA: hypothetical protein VFR37_21600 [Longimicrobium sp.]|nr:hypothetical protein [Longimicrobium sp.]
MPAVLGLAAIAVGLACILADDRISRAVWREDGSVSGATSMRVLGLILFVAGGLAVLSWTP